MRAPFVRTAKVVAVHRESHSVDIVLMDGQRIRDVPVLNGLAGSNFGLAGLVAPDADGSNPNRKTYPGPDGAGRDVYAVVVQAEGSSFGTNGMFVLGFMYPMVSEMMFDSSQPDLLVFRHPSDVQVTIDKDGKTSVQHPAGARITIGKDYGEADLEGKDYDKLYRLRNNLSPVKVGIQMRDTAGSTVTLDHEGNIALDAPKNVTVKAGENIEAEAGADITAKAGGDITAQADGDITAKSGGDTTVKAQGDVKVKAQGDLKAEASGNADVKASGQLTVKGQMVMIN